MAADTSQTVERALRVLQSFNRDYPALGIADLSKSLELPRTVVLRLLTTLEQSGFVVRVPGDSRYRLGLAAFELGAVYAATNPLIACADEALDALVDRTGHTAYLGILDGQDALILSLHEGRNPVRFIWAVGERLPATTTALGKAILVHTPTDALDRIVGTGRLPGLTERSIATRRQLDEDLQRARERGWAVAQDESQPGVSAVGAAILDGSGRPVAGISISFLDYPPDPDRSANLGLTVREVAEAITRQVARYAVYGQPSLQRPRSRTNNDGHRPSTGAVRAGTRTPA